MPEEISPGRFLKLYSDKTKFYKEQKLNNLKQTILVYLKTTLLVSLILTTGCRKKADTTPSTAIQAGNITILDTRTDQTDRSRAKQNVEDSLIRYSDIDCLVGLWAYNGPAILSAVKSAGKEGKVNIVCFDEEPDVIQGVKDGYIFSTVVQQPYKFGYLSVKVLAALARGDTSVIPANKKIDVPVMIINKDNADKFWQDLQKLRSGSDTGAKKIPVQNEHERVSVALLANSAADFWKIAYTGAKLAEKEFNAKCEFMMPPTGTAEEQKRMLQSLVTRGITGVAMSPIDPANQTEIINEVGKKMNIVTQDSDAPQSNRLCYIGTDNYKAGREAGKLIKQALPQGGKIMLFVGTMDAQNAIDRRKGIIDELSGKPIPE